ncbi:RNA exonuclease Rex3 [Penicillium alfredii]|uniref:RNA exonuclease Rex3 n=1 Tax=Penicillium alfredii TaxID=1506179 RepID=A0A9W9KRL1_9EURO|nr:RNA exonuclease Rex3 [Penicillium alfredii]KAJ5115397.1 RNA exonuclease Rex3 [Penicillium alfredii]
MFSTLGLFGDIPCPQGQQCSLLTCLFSHKSLELPSVGSNTSQAATPAIDDSARASKRVKREAASDSSVSSHNKPATGIAINASTSEVPNPPQSTSQDAPKLQSTTRAVTPPPSTRPVSRSSQQEHTNAVASASSDRSMSQLPPRKAPKESLNPRMLTKAPANHGVRTAILKRLHLAMSALNEKLAKEKESTNKCFVLTRDELVTMALDEEEKVARESPGVYSNVIKLRIVKLTKLGLEDWAKDVMAHLNTRYYHVKPIQAPQEAPKPLDTGLTTKEEIALASHLVMPLHGLEQFGYVTKAPTEAEVKTAEKGVAESKGWEKCDRCGGRFQVFPGRREDGALASGGQCTYHPSRPIYPPRKKTDHVTGSSDAYYPCCSEALGTSSGCTKATTHVFKVSETKRLASILQFGETPKQPDKGPLEPVCLDCEMGYTTLGLELIRLTAVSWPEGRDLLDVLVKPMGEVLDLNSRYSGVFPQHFASAVPYGTLTTRTEASTQPEKEKNPVPLQVAESPAAARALLFRLLQPETPLIGHAIDNDLNVCRVIHPTVIDTVLLYPHPKGRLPNRMSLKTLARKFLDRDIQTGGDRGHDSKEDSIATGDLVRVKAGETWKGLKKKGWRIEGDKLVPPVGHRPVVREPSLGAGHKRKG